MTEGGIDYAALAQQAGGQMVGGASPPPQPEQQPAQPTPPAQTAPSIDYAALAQQAGGTAATAAPATQQGTSQPHPDESSIIPALSEMVHNYVNDVKQRIGNTPDEFFSKAKDRITNMNEGIVRYVDRGLLTGAKAARSVDQAHGLFPQGHPLDDYIANTEKIVNAPLPSDPELAGAQTEVGENVAAAGQQEATMGVLKALGVLDKFASLGIKSYPQLSRVVRNAIAQGGAGFSQALSQGQSLPQALLAAGETGVVGALVDAPQARVESRAATAAELAPTEQNVRGVPFTTLASEQPGATPQQTAAATIAEAPTAMRQERQAAWQQLPVNLAKDAVRTALTDTNNASVADLRQRLKETDDPTLEANLAQQVKDVERGGQGAPAWSYITPEGIPMTPGETRAGLNDLREHWLSQEWTPEQDQAIQDRYNDMKDQLNRFDTMHGTQPMGPIYHVDDAVNSTNSFADAANHMRIVSDRALAEMPPSYRERYQEQAQTLSDLQDEFDRNAGVPKLQRPIQNEIGRINRNMQDILNEPDVADAISAPRAQQAIKDKRLSDAFQALHNVMTSHVTLLPNEAADLGRPSEAKGSFGSLVSDIRAIQSQYGDVLNPAIGDRGLNHILDLGQYMQMPQGRPRVQSLLGNMVMVLRRHFQGLRGMVRGSGATVGAYTLAHLLGHATGATGVGLGALAAEAQSARTNYKLATDPVFNRMIRNRLSTDPNFAQRFIFASRYVPPRHAAPLLGAMLMNALKPDQEDQTDATGR